MNCMRIIPVARTSRSLPFGPLPPSALSSAIPAAPASTTHVAAWKCIPGLTK